MNEHNWAFPCAVAGVVDGDTFDLEIDQGFRQRLTERVRLRGVDTAEIYGVKKESDEYERGMDHKAFVKNWLAEGRSRVSRPYPFVVETASEEGSFNRYLADIGRYSEEDPARLDPVTLTDALIDEYGDSVVYDG